MHYDPLNFVNNISACILAPEFPMGAYFEHQVSYQRERVVLMPAVPSTPRGKLREAFE